VFFRSGERTFFVYGFAKSARDNITKGELKAFKNDAKDHIALSDEHIEAWLKKGTLIEVF
jgi:hypothetical protein